MVLWEELMVVEERVDGKEEEGVEVGDMVYLSPPLDVDPPTFDQSTPNDQSPAGLPAEEGR